MSLFSTMLKHFQEAVDDVARVRPLVGPMVPMMIDWLAKALNVDPSNLHPKCIIIMLYALGSLKVSGDKQENDENDEDFYSRVEADLQEARIPSSTAAAAMYNAVEMIKLLPGKKPQCISKESVKKQALKYFLQQKLTSREAVNDLKQKAPATEVFKYLQQFNVTDILSKLVK